MLTGAGERRPFRVDRHLLTADRSTRALEQPFVLIQIVKFPLDNARKYGLPFRLPTTIGWNLDQFIEQPGSSGAHQLFEPSGTR
jgi:hypothetical protein